MTISSIAPPPGGRPLPWAAALLTAAAIHLAGCGGDDNIQAVAAPAPPPPAPTGAASQAVPTTAEIVAAQATIDHPVSSVALPTTGAITAAQINAQQAALDGSTSSGLDNLASNQVALDQNGVQPYVLTPLR